MNRTNVSIFFGTLYSLLYAVAVVLPTQEKMSEMLWLFSPAMIVIVILCILTDKHYHTNKTFDEYFYQDEDLRRNVTNHKK